jgi:hypothetical protein
MDWNSSMIYSRLCAAPVVVRVVVHTETWWLTWNKVRPYLVRLNRLLFSPKKQRWVKQLSKTKKTSICEKRDVFEWLLVVLWRIKLGPIYTTRLLSLHKSLNRLLFVYSSTCELCGLYLTIFIYLNSELGLTRTPIQLDLLPNSVFSWTEFLILGPVLAYPSLDSSLLELKVLIPLWTRTPSQLGHVSSIFFLNSSGQLCWVTFNLSAYSNSPDWLTWILPEQLTQTPPGCLIRSHQCLPGLIRSYPAELPYLILLSIRLLLIRPYTVLPGQSTLPDSSPDQTSTYPALHGLTQPNYLTRSLPDRTSAEPIVLGHLTRLPNPIG